MGSSVSSFFEKVFHKEEPSDEPVVATATADNANAIGQLVPFLTCIQDEIRNLRQEFEVKLKSIEDRITKVESEQKRQIGYVKNMIGKNLEISYSSAMKDMVLDQFGIQILVQPRPRFFKLTSTIQKRIW